jgi:hypothetical protein
MAAMSRQREFFSADALYIDNIIENTTAKNTKSLTSLSIKAFWDYLSSKGMPQD